MPQTLEYADADGLLVFATFELQVGDVSRKKHLPRPLNGDAQFSPQRGHLREVIGAPQQPGGQTRERQTSHLGHAFHVAYGRDHATGPIVKVRSLLAGNMAAQIQCEVSRLTHRELGSGRRRLPIKRIGDQRAVSQRPHPGQARHRHVASYDDAAALQI